MTPEPTPSIAYDVFVSYAHADNLDGWVTALVETLQAEHAKFTPTPLSIFFDLEEIRTMDDWEHRIYRGLRNAKVMLTVLSPNYFKSPYCRMEWERYLENELTFSTTGEGIAPIYTVTVPRFEVAAEASADLWSANLRRRQFLDLRDCRFEGLCALQHERVRRLIEGLDQRIHTRLEKAGRAASSRTTIPPHNEHFVGRQDEMRRLRESLALSRVGVITAVHGIGGIGKSALAFEYAHAFAEDYPGGRYLVSCAGVDDPRIPILNLAEHKGISLSDDDRKNLDVAFTRVRIAFERGPRSLLLFDTVDDPDLLAPHKVTLILPSNDRMHIVATTRLGPDRLPGLVCVPLDSLPPEDAVRLLETYRPFANDDERKSALWIVRRLGGHPLAVEVVGVYLWQTPDVRYAGFADRLRNEGICAVTGAAGEEGVSLSRHPEKFLTALLEPTLARLSPSEWLAMQFAALLPRGPIAVPWLRELVSQQYAEVGMPAKPGHPDVWERLLRRLHGLRLLHPGDIEHLARMHSLVQEIVAARLGADGIAERWAAVIAHVSSRAVFLWKEWGARSGRWEIDPLLAFAWFLLGTNQLEVGPVFAIRVGRPLQRLGRFEEARALLGYAIKKLAEGQVSSQPILATCYGNLAAVELLLGNHAEAKRLFEQAIAINEGAEQPKEIDLVIQYSGLGVVEEKLGNRVQAKHLQEKALGLADQARISHEPVLASCYSNLAIIEGDLGHTEEGNRLLRLAIELTERDSNPDRASLATMYCNLASIEQDLGNHVEAKYLLDRSVACANEVYDADHPAYITIYANVGMNEHKLGNLDEAKRNLVRAIEIASQVYVTDHPDLATQYSNLATVEQSMGNHGEVRRLMQLVHGIRHERLGPEHPLTESAADWLSRCDQNATTGGQDGN
jgi:tetratricopeptide (TPR) repeat protein